MPKNRKLRPRKVLEVSILGGKAVSVPAYYEGQNAEGTPNHFVSLSEANSLKEKKLAVSIHRGKAILIKGPRRAIVFHREFGKSRWAVVGQTNRNSGPGFPHYSSV